MRPEQPAKRISVTGRRDLGLIRLKTGAFCGHSIFPRRDDELELGWKPRRVLTRRGRYPVTCQVDTKLKGPPKRQTSLCSTPRLLERGEKLGEPRMKMTELDWFVILPLHPTKHSPAHSD